MMKMINKKAYWNKEELLKTLYSYKIHKINKLIQKIFLYHQLSIIINKWINLFIKKALIKIHSKKILKNKAITKIL